MFDRSHFARFLAGNNFDVKKAIGHFNEYLQWRKQQKIDSLLVNYIYLILIGIGV